MKQFNEDFYTADFDQEMVDFLLREGHAVTGQQQTLKPDTKDKYLKYSKAVGCFWTDSFGVFKFRHLTKQQFKEKIGMTEKSSEKKIKHWLVETLPENTTCHPKSFIATNLSESGSSFYGEKSTGDWFDCYKLRWKYTPVYEETVSQEDYSQDNPFTKSMLKSGQVVDLKEDCVHNRGIVIEDKILFEDGILSLDSFTSDLEFKDEWMRELGIIKVFVTGRHFGLRDLSSGENLTLIWQRETPEQAQKRLKREELEKKVCLLKEELKQAENELKEV